jgi:hypothetical protein
VATRLYLRNVLQVRTPSYGKKSTVLPVGTADLNSGTDWEDLSLSLTKGTAQNSKTINSLAQSTHQDIYVARFTSDPLDGQDILANTWTLGLATSEANLAANSFTVLSVYVFRPSTQAVVGFIYDSDTPLGVEWGTTENGQVPTVAGSLVTAQKGDVLILEVWAHSVQGMSTAFVQTLFFDGTTDVVSGTSADAASYIETPQTLYWQGGLDPIYVFARNGSWSPMSGPSRGHAAIHFNGNTYLCYYGDGTNNTPFATKFNPTTGARTAETQAGTPTLPSTDGHGNPVLMVDSSNVMHLFFDAHGTNLKHSKANLAEDTSAWTAQTALTVSFETYPNFFRRTNGTIYRFYRNSTAAPAGGEEFSTSTDEMVSWSATTRIIDFADSGIVTNIYALMPLYDYERDIFHIGFIYFNNTTGGRPSIYYAYYNPVTGHMHNAAGTDLGALPLNKATADANCLIESAADLAWNIGDVVCMPEPGTGFPHIVYTFPTSATVSEWRHTYWNGSSWVKFTNVAPTPGTSGASGWNNCSLVNVYARNNVDWLLVTPAPVTPPLIGGGNLDLYNFDGSTWKFVRTVLSFREAGNRYLFGPQKVWHRNGEAVVGPNIIFDECANGVQSTPTGVGGKVYLLQLGPSQGAAFGDTWEDPFRTWSDFSGASSQLGGVGYGLQRPRAMVSPPGPSELIFIPPGMAPPVMVSGTGAIAEASSLLLSQAPKGAGTISEASSLIRSENPSGSEGIAEAFALMRSAKPTGTEGIAEASSILRGAKPTGSEGIAELSSLRLSQAPKGTEGIAEASSIIRSAKPSGAEGVSETSSLLRSAKPSGSEGISELSSLIRSAKPAGTGSISELSSLVVGGSASVSGAGHIGETSSIRRSANISRTENISESSSLIRSAKPSAVGAIAEASSIRISANPSKAQGISEASSIVLSVKPTASGAITVTASLFVPGGAGALLTNWIQDDYG